MNPDNPSGEIVCSNPFVAGLSNHARPCDRLMASVFEVHGLSVMQAGLSLFIFLAFAGMAAAEGIRVAPDRVESVIVSYLWNGYAPKSTQSELLIVHQRDGKWTRRVFLRDGRDVTIREILTEEQVRQHIGQIVSALENATPSLGLHTCNNHTDDYPEYNVRILLKGDRRVLLRSTSNCLKTLPWNVTDGKQLRAVYDENLPEAIFALIGRKTSHGLGPGPEPLLPAGQPVTMDTLFTALTNELNRLLVENPSSGQWTDLNTGHLVAAMAWMNRDGLRKRLQQLAKSPRTAEMVRRHVEGLIERLAEEAESLETLPLPER